MLPSDSGNRSSKKYSTFLGVDPGTLTIQKIKRKGARDKKAADKRAPIVNQGIERQNRTLNNVLTYSRASENLWNQTKNKSRFSFIATPTPAVDYARTHNPYSRIASLISDSPNKQNRTANSYSFRFGGQFGAVRPSIKDFNDAFTPETPQDYARVAAAADTAQSTDEYNFYNRHRLNSQLHNAVIKRGQEWMVDSQLYMDWVLSAATPEEQEARNEEGMKYFEQALHKVPTYDPNTHTYVEQMQFNADAPLPPWIEQNGENAILWQYYTTYSNAVVDKSVQAYYDARNEGREQERNPYKSAFANTDQNGQIDSFLDVFIQSYDKRGFDATYDKLLPNFTNYIRDYIWRPLKTGPEHWKTAAGNMLWNYIDTSDVALRGVRAFFAGTTTLGGAGGQEFERANSKFDDYYAKTWEKYGLTPKDAYEEKKNHGKFVRKNDTQFNGQDVYWAHIDGYDLSNEEDLAKVQAAQRRFMDNGGLELLLGAHQKDATFAQRAHGKAVTDKAERKAIEDRLDELFEYSDINWRDIYKDIDENYFTDEYRNNFDRRIENVKESYNDVDANYNTDTGNMVADMVIETFLDPLNLVGGVSRSLSKGIVSSAAESAVRKGFKDIALDDDTSKLILRNKYIRGAINQFAASNEGKNIIFKSAKDFDNDVDLLIKKLREFGVFGKDETAKAFKDSVTSELMNKHISVNGKLIASQGFSHKILGDKAVKSIYYLGQVTDAVESAIVKSSFFLPWAGLRGSRAFGNAVITNDMVRTAFHKLKLRKANAAKLLVDDMTNNINVTKVSDLMDKFESGMLHQNDVRAAFQLAVDEYDNIAWNINDVIRQFSRGEITDEEALRIVGEFIHNATGGQYRYVHELAGYVNSIAHRYAGDIRDAYGRIDKTFTRLQNLIDHRSESAVSTFLDKVRQAKNSTELMALFREYMDNPYIMDLRDQVVDNAQFRITSGEIDEIVDSVRTGRFADIAIDNETISRGLTAQAKISDKTLTRVVKFDTMDNMLTKMGVNWRGVLSELETSDVKPDIFEKKISEFMSNWAKRKYVTYSTDDMLRFIDRFERQLQFRELMNIDTASEVSALAAHSMTGQFNKLRKQVKRMDLVNLKDVKAIILPQIDRMALNIEFRNNTDIRNLYGWFYDEVIGPMWDQFRTAMSDDADLMESDLFKVVDTLTCQKRGYDRTSQLIDALKMLPGLSDEHLHSVLNTLVTDFRFRDDMGNIDLNPGALRRRIETDLRTHTGESKVGMKQITDYLQSLKSDNPSKFLEKYCDEYTSKPALKARLDKYIQKDVLDPTAYVEKQILFTALADPSVIPEWNALAAKGQAPIAMHISSTGLNTEINSMTSISFRKWVPIEISDKNPLTLEKLLDALDSGETKVFQRYMRDDEFGEFTEQVLRKLDIKDSNVDNIMNRLKEVYGIPKDGAYKSEEQMIEEVCAYLGDATVLSDDGLRSVAPVLLVHDLDGFNVDYLNNKIMSGSATLDKKSKTYDYFTRVSKSAKDNACNTYTRLAEQVGDLYYTEEQLELITSTLRDYVDDINHFAKGYRFNDVQSYSRVMHKMINDLKLKEDANELTDREKQILDSFRNSNGEAALEAYDKAVKDITDLGLYPRQFAFLSSDIDENFTKAAMDATHRSAINTGTRIYVDDVLSYFNLETEDGFYAPVEDLRKMNEVAQYIIRTRNRQIVAGADEFLRPYKADFDRMIQSVIDIANNDSYSATQLAYLKNMKVPDNAIDSYLMAKKLYMDHLKYWLDTDSLTSLSTGGKELDAFKERLLKKGYALGFKDPAYALEKQKVFNQACSFINDNRIRMFDELIGGGFDRNRYDSIAELSERFAEETVEFWDDTASTTSRMWDDFKEFNATVKDEYEERYDKLSQQYNAAQTDKAFKDYYYNQYQAGVKLYHEQKKQQDELRKILRDVKDPDDPRFAEFEANQEYLKDLRESNDELFAMYSANKKAYQEDWFDTEEIPNKVSKRIQAKIDKLINERNKLVQEAESARTIRDTELNSVQADMESIRQTLSNTVDDVKFVNDRNDTLLSLYLYPNGYSIKSARETYGDEVGDLIEQWRYLRKDYFDINNKSEFNKIQGRINKIDYELSQLQEPPTKTKRTYKLHGKYAEMKAEKEQAKAGMLHPGWGRKTTQRQIKKAVRDTLSGTSLSATERKVAADKIDEAAKRAARAMSEGHYAKAGEIIFDAVEEITNNMKYMDNEAYDLSRELREYLRSTAISTDSIKYDITDFGHFRKQHFGSYRLHKQGLEYDKVLQELKDLFPQYFNGYDAEGPSGFFEYVDNILSNSNPKAVDFTDAEKEYRRDELVNAIYNTLYSRPGYSVSDTDDNFTEVYNRYVYQKKRPVTYEGVKALTDTEYALAQEEYVELAARHRLEINNALDNTDVLFDTPDDILDLLSGAHEPEIYNWAARSDFEKQVLNYKDNVMKSGLDKATHYMEAGSQIKSEMRQLQHIDEYFATAGIVTRRDRMTASVYTKTKQLFDILGGSNFLKRGSFHDFLQKASRVQRLQLQQYRLNSLRNADGAFDRYKLLSELVYNGFNMTVFNTFNYTPKETDELLDFVKKLQDSGDDFLSYYEDRSTGNIFIYLNDNCTVAEADGGRWINQRWKFDRPVHEVVPFADFDELKEVLDIDDIEDFRGVYAHLQSCWEDTRLLSLGQINGTTGRTVSRRNADEFIQSLPSNMNDWLTSEGLLQDELTRGVIYDPGFIMNEESDMLTDFLGTLHRQAEVIKDDAILINEVFHSTGSVQFNELAEHFHPSELVEYFGENPEYVVCTIVADNNTASGFKVQQLNLSNEAGVEIARNMQNTTILPYSTFYELANYMNRDVTDNVYKKLLGKYMLVYKAFSLVRPGTWMRNFIDATTKAAFDNVEGIDNVFSMLQYEGKAARDIGTYGRIIASDPKLLTPANWDIVQKTFKTDMTFDEFELLRGIMDTNNFKSADKYYLSRTAGRRGGFNVISGDEVGLRNLDEKDIKDAVKKYLIDEPDLPLKESEFLDIYLGRAIPDDETKQLYEDVFRKLSNNLRNSNAGTIFDKTIDIAFKPFGSVEHLVRYAQTLQLMDNGFSSNQITRHIHNTQFYNAPVWGKWRTLETIMPFITFKYNNMMYWVRMMDENPQLYRYFADTYRSVYETSIESALEEGVELDYETDYGLQSGAIPLGNGQRYFNMGSSLLSAMNDFYGLPTDVDSLNPLLRATLKTSAYALGFNSNKYYTNMDLTLTDEEVIDNMKEIIPGYSLIKKGMKTFKDISGMSTSEDGPTMNALYSVLNFLGVLGIRGNYDQKDGRFSMAEYQYDLSKQGKWYDCNLGKVVPLSQKNEFGANNPENSFEDIQTYMLVHFGKVWDANQRAFVQYDEFQPGGYNDGFDFENDPEAWNKLCAYMKEQGKVYDYNQRKFVYQENVIGGGLNDPFIKWDTKVKLMEEVFGLKWDANQQAFVEDKYYIPGGMNDFSQYEGQDFLRHWNELKSLRLALYGETYDSETHTFVKTAEPTLALMHGFMDYDTKKRYENYYALLGIPQINSVVQDMHMNSEGFFVNSQGQYLITGNPEYDSKVFDRFRYTYSGGYGGRRYYGYKNYSYRKTRRSSKTYGGRTMAPTYYQRYSDINYTNGYQYEYEYDYNYHYTSPNPGTKLNYLITPPKHYPYGGGYNKFSFISRY